METNRFWVGVDLGQSKDFTAIAVIERVETLGESRDAATWERERTVELQVRYLERVPLGTPYPEVVERVAALARSRPLAGRCEMVVDATGVGRPVVDLLRAEELECEVRAVVVTGGDEERSSGGFDRVPKRDLILKLQLLLQKGTLRIAAGLRYAGALAQELGAMQVKVTATGHEQFGAWREGTHDDLVFAVALACWGAGGVEPPTSFFRSDRRLV